MFHSAYQGQNPKVPAALTSDAEVCRVTERWGDGRFELVVKYQNHVDVRDGKGGL
jgi:hypothetical protein